MRGMLHSLVQYRQFIYSSIRNDLIHRFAASKLGGLWSILNPLSQVLIYALILSNVLHAKLGSVDSKYAYAIYLMAGLLGWNLFNEILSQCLSLFVAQGNLLKKVNFPRIVLPTIVAGSCIVSNILLFLVMVVIFMILGHHFSLQILWLIPLTLIVVLFAMGAGLILGVMNVFVRDIGQVVPILLQVWFWLTPIVYPVTIIPSQYRYLLELNPMYAVIQGYQQVIMYNHTPDTSLLSIIAAIALALSLMSVFLFRRASPEMVDVL